MRDEEFEWDDRKAKRNERRHGVTFELARLVFDDPNAIDRLDLDEPDEDRELITGLVGDVLLTVLRRARSPQTHPLGLEGNEQ
jgi:uncharacterized DUF497 family protein